MWRFKVAAVVVALAASWMAPMLLGALALEALGGPSCR